MTTRVRGWGGYCDCYDRYIYRYEWGTTEWGALRIVEKELDTQTHTHISQQECLIHSRMSFVKTALSHCRNPRAIFESLTQTKSVHSALTFCLLFVFAPSLDVSAVTRRHLQKYVIFYTFQFYTNSLKMAATCSSGHSVVRTAQLVVCVFAGPKGNASFKI